MKVDYVTAWGYESTGYIEDMPDSSGRYKGEDKYSDRAIVLVNIEGRWIEPVWGVTS